MSVLKVECIGHLGKDATVNTVSGKNVINFTVAHTESYKKADGTKVENTTWLSCSYWNDSTAVAQYLKKGTLVYIEGLPAPRIYDGKQGAAIDFAVKVFKITLLAQPKDANAQSATVSAPAAGGAYVPPAATGNGAYVPLDEPIDGLPF